MKILSVFLIALSIVFSCFASAQTSNDAEIEERARIVGRSLRCVVCQNQSIDNSNAPLAADMRVMVRARIRAGDSNAQTIEFMRERYGDFVLLKPPVQANTIILWVMPIGLMALLLIWYVMRSRRSVVLNEVLPLSDDELEHYTALVKNEEPKR